MDKNFKILVVDDEYLILNNLAQKIQNLNSNFNMVETAQDGQSALEKFLIFRPDVIFTDIKMPVMDGLSLISSLRQLKEEVPCVIVSGYDDFRYARKAICLDVKDYLLKPVKTKELEILLAKLEAELNTHISTHSPGHRALTDTESLAYTIAEYLRKNYASAIDFQLLAKQYGFSSAYLSKVFTKYIGIPPLRFLTALRIEQAQVLLADSLQLNISQIGCAVGYDNAFYFSRIFKQITGKTPQEYRNLLMHDE